MTIMTTTNRIVWTDEMAIAARSGERVTPWAVPTDQVEEVDGGCVTYRLTNDDPNLVRTVTVWPATGRAGVATNGNSEWGDYSGLTGGVTLDEGEAIVVHEALGPVLRRVAHECVSGWIDTSDDWHIVAGTEYADVHAWCAELPADGDVERMASAVVELTGRVPTRVERDAFAKMFRDDAWDRLPVRASTDV